MIRTFSRAGADSRSRSIQGNMLAFSAVLGGMVALAILIGLGFYMILSHQQRGQAVCDQASMALSKALNAGDRIGQMNAVVEHARELVYLSRQNVETAFDLRLTPYQALSQQLLEEARDGAGIVEKERQNQLKLALTEGRDMITKMRKPDGSPKGVFILPWLFETRPNITDVKYGFIKGTLSSVESPAVLTELQKYDLKQHYLEPTSKLFLGNINAKLPPPDDDLFFHFASLTPEVKHVDVPPRLVHGSVFVSTANVFNEASPNLFQKPQELPSAVQVLGTIGIETSKKTELELKIVSSAAANSALQAP